MIRSGQVRPGRASVVAIKDFCGYQHSTIWNCWTKPPASHEPRRLVRPRWTCPQLACPTGTQGSLANEPDSPVTRLSRGSSKRLVPFSSIRTLFNRRHEARELSGNKICANKSCSKTSFLTAQAKGLRSQSRYCWAGTDKVASRAVSTLEGRDLTAFVVSFASAMRQLECKSGVSPRFSHQPSDQSRETQSHFSLPVWHFHRALCNGECLSIDFSL